MGIRHRRGKAQGEDTEEIRLPLGSRLQTLKGQGKSEKSTGGGAGTGGEVRDASKTIDTPQKKRNRWSSTGGQLGSGEWMGFEHCGDTRGPAQLEFPGRASLGPARILHHHHGLEM